MMTLYYFYLMIKNRYLYNIKMEKLHNQLSSIFVVIYVRIAVFFLGGLQCVFMAIRASQKGTGY